MNHKIKISNEMKRFEINRFCSNLRKRFNISLEELRKIKKIFHQSRLYAGQNLQPPSPKGKLQEFLAKYIEYPVFVRQ